MGDGEGPRLTPVAAPDLDDAQRELLAPALSGIAGTAANLYATLIRHPGLFRRWMPFGGKLLVGKLSPRDREILILRTGWRCQAEYEWGQHVVIARNAGLTDEEIRQVRVGDQSPEWEIHERALLRCVDELHVGAKISDGTWQELADHYDEKQLIEILMVVGAYHLVAFVTNGLEIQRDPGIPGFSE